MKALKFVVRSETQGNDQNLNKGQEIIALQVLYGTVEQKLSSVFMVSKPSLTRFACETQCPWLNWYTDAEEVITVSQPACVNTQWYLQHVLNSELPDPKHLPQEVTLTVDNPGIIKVKQLARGNVVLQILHNL